MDHIKSVDCQGGGEVGEFGVSRCKLLYTEWVNNKVLLYSTENYIQYPVINQEKNIYIYILIIIYYNNYILIINNYIINIILLLINIIYY